MHCPERPAAYLLLDNILIDAMLRNTVVLAGDIFGSCVEGFLQRVDKALCGKVFECGLP
jgi:hypothetical protein